MRTRISQSHVQHGCPWLRKQPVSRRGNAGLVNAMSTKMPPSFACGPSVYREPDRSHRHWWIRPPLRRDLASCLAAVIDRVPGLRPPLCAGTWDRPQTVASTRGASHRAAGRPRPRQRSVPRGMAPESSLCRLPGRPSPCTASAGPERLHDSRPIRVRLSRGPGARRIPRLLALHAATSSTRYGQCRPRGPHRAAVRGAA